MRVFLVLLLTAVTAWAGELDPAQQAFTEGRYAEGAALVRQATEGYKRLALIPSARRALQDALARCESAAGPDSEPVETLALELSVLYLAQNQPNQGLEQLARANRIARLRGRFEPDRELQLATLQVGATKYEEGFSTLEALVPRLEKEFGLTDPRTVRAMQMLATACKRKGDPAAVAALEQKLAQAGPSGPADRAVAAPAAGGPHISQSYLRAEGNFKKLLASGRFKIVEHSSQQIRLDAIGAKIAAAGRRNIPWHFFIVNDKGPNAACMGEGFVYVTTGLLALGLTDNELAGVLAHEVAHGTEMHLDNQDVDKGIAMAALKELKEAQALADRYEREYQADGNDISYNSKMVTVKRRISSAEKKIAYLEGKDKHSAEFGQQQEMEADQVGMRYAVTAGYSAEGLMGALQKLQAATAGRSEGRVNAAGRTHPPIDRRIETLHKVYDAWQRQGFR